MNLVMKTEFFREYKSRLRLILRSKLNGKNKIKAINGCLSSIMIYGAGVLEWRFDELKELDRKTRKLLTMHSKKNSTQKLMLTDFTLVENREEEDW